MNAWIEFLGLWLADFYLAATILLTIAAILFIVIRQPAPRVAVGWGSLLGLLIAAGLCLSPSRPRFDLRPFFIRPATPVAETEPTRAPIAPPPVVETAAPRSDAAEELPFDRFEPTQLPVEQSVRTDAPTTEPVSSAPPAVAWGPRFAALAVGLFLAGLVAMASWLIVGVLRASRLVRRSAPAPDGCCEELRKIAGPAARLPRLRMNARLVMPVATGTFRPAILLPQGFAETGSRNALKAVLAHEWTHIKNGDLWLLAFDRLILTLLWAHPLYWWTRRRIRTNQELLADAAAASQIGPTDYAALLVDWARNLAAHRSLTALTAVGIWERPAALELRVTEILNQDHEKQHCSGRIRAALLVCLAGLGLIATSLSLRPPLAKSAPPSVPLAAVQSQSPPESPPGVAALKADPLPPSAKAEKIVDYHVNKDEIGGLCLERGEKRVPGIEVSLYLDRFGGPDNPDRRLLDRTTSNAEGQFLFRRVPEPVPHAERFLLIARKQGRQTAIGQLDHRHDWIDLGVPRAVPLKGSVKDQQGRPIAGALVRCDQQGFYGLPETIRSARTNSRGEFEINDVVGVGTCVIEHPQYARRTLFRTKASALAEVRLVQAGVIEGQVLDSGTGQPVGGLLVGMQCINRPHRGDLADLDDADFFFAQAKTTANGRYRIGEIPTGTFNVYPTSTISGRASVAIDSLKVAAGQTVQAPPIRLVKGGVVKGRLIESSTDKPALVAEDEWVSIGAYGPSRPRSGASIQGTRVREDGSFEIRLPPGKNYVYLSGGPFLVRKPGDPYATQDIREINVKEGEETTIEFRVTRQVPMKKAPANSTKKSPVPTSGAVNRSAPIAVAEAPNFSPKIVDYQVGKDEIAGLCIGQREARLAAVDVSLYVDRFGGAVEQRSQRLFGRTTTNSDGQFLFQHVPQVNPRAERFFVIARRQDLATALETLDHRHDWVELKMRLSRELKGTVKDTQGHPVADAFVRCDQSTFYKLPEGVKSTRTNARGEFEIDDVSGVGRCIVEHSGYPRKVLNGPEITDPFDIILDKRSAVIEGRVMSETGDSMAGLIVGLQGIDGQNEHATRFYSQAKTDQEGRYQLRSLPPGKFNVCVMSSLGEGVGLALDSIEVGPDQKTQAPALRIVKGGVVKGRLIDDATGGPAVLGKDERVSIGVHGPSRPRSGGGIEAFPVKSDGSFEMRLPPGQNDVFVIGGGPFFVRDADNHYTTQSFQVVDVKVGEEATIEFHVLRDAPPKKVPDEATRKSPTPSSAALSRPAPVAMAEAPNVSPKIVDYHLARSMKLKNAAPEQRSEIVRPSPKEVLGYLPANVAKWLASGSQADRDRMRVTVEPAIDRTGECRFYPLVGRARLQQCVFKCSVALDKVPHADAPLDIQETIKAPLVFYMQQNHLICCDDSVAQR